jgi:hypothetical protein
MKSRKWLYIHHSMQIWEEMCRRDRKTAEHQNCWNQMQHKNAINIQVQSSRTLMGWRPLNTMGEGRNHTHRRKVNHQETESQYSPEQQNRLLCLVDWEGSNGLVGKSSRRLSLNQVYYLWRNNVDKSLLLEAVAVASFLLEALYCLVETKQSFEPQK